MYPEIDTKDIAAVRSEVQAIYRDLFPSVNDWLLSESFRWAEGCFAGRYADFQAIDAKYHDLEHTLQVTLCYARLLQGYSRAGMHPPIRPRDFELGVLAMLLHDTGYLKRRGDSHGTGAKYTLVHVNRSADFAARLLREKGFPEDEIRSIQNMIRCTGVNADLAGIPFQSELERRMGFALATADLVGQMAAHDYIEKLEILYQEFEESVRYSGKANSVGAFASAEDLRRRTPAFWEKYVLPRISGDFLGLYKFLGRPDPEGPNDYLDKIRANIHRLQQQLATPVAA